MREPAGEPFVGLHQVPHLVLVAGADHHELAPVVLHPDHKPFQSLDPLGIRAVARVVERCERIGLVYEKDSAHRLVHSLVHVLVRLVGVGAYDVLAALLDDTVCGAYSHGLEQLAEHSGHGCLSSSGVSGEDDVHRTDRSLASELHPALLETHLLRKIPQGFLDGLHSDERVQLLHHAFHRDLLRAVRPGDVLPGQDFARAGIFIITQTRRSGAEPLEAAVEGVAHLAGIAEGVGAAQVHPLKIFPHLARCLVRKGQPLLFHHIQEYLGEFLAIVVLELYFLLESGIESRVGAQEHRHLLGVAGDYADEVSGPVLKVRQQGVYGFLTNLVVVSLLEGVGLIDEQDSAHCLVDDLFGLEGSVSDILRDKILACHLDQMAAREHLKTAQDVGEQPCDRGLSRAWIACEDKVAFQLHRLAGIVPLLSFDAVDDGLNLLFDFCQASEGVDPGHDLFLGEFLERLSRNVGLLDLGATPAEHIEGALFGYLSGQDSVLLGSAATEHLLEDKSQPPFRLRTDRRPELVPDH